MGTTPDTSELATEKYISLTTYRRDGSPVATPVWFVVEGGRLLVWTSAASWKAKRLRVDPHVRVAVCDARGRAHGPSWDGTARFLPSDAGERVERMLRRKYPVARRLLGSWAAVARLFRGRAGPGSAYLEIVLGGTLSA